MPQCHSVWGAAPSSFHVRFLDLLACARIASFVASTLGLSLPLLSLYRCPLSGHWGVVSLAVEAKHRLCSRDQRHRDREPREVEDQRSRATSRSGPGQRSVLGTFATCKTHRHENNMSFGSHTSATMKGALGKGIVVPISQCLALGIAELPLDVIRNRPPFSSTADLRVKRRDSTSAPFSDGSVQGTSHPLASASFACIPGPSNRLFGDLNRWFLGTCCHQ